MVYQTPNFAKAFFREQYRRFFETDEPDSILYLYNIVQYLMAFKEANNLEQTLGVEKYKQIQESLKKFQKLYVYSSHLRKLGIESAKTGTQYGNSLATSVKQELSKIAKASPLVREDIIQAFFLLTNNTDLRNLQVPKRETGWKPQQFQSEGGMR